MFIKLKNGRIINKYRIITFFEEEGIVAGKKKKTYRIVYDDMSDRQYIDIDKETYDLLTQDIINK